MCLVSCYLVIWLALGIVLTTAGFAFSKLERSDQTFCANMHVVCLSAGEVFPVKEGDPLSLSLLGWAWGPAPVPGRGHLTALGLAEGWDGAALWRPLRLKAQTLRVTSGLWVPNKCKVLSCQGIHCTWLWVIPPSSQQWFAKHLSVDLSSQGS